MHLLVRGKTFFLYLLMVLSERNALNIYLIGFKRHKIREFEKNNPALYSVIGLVNALRYDVSIRKLAAN